MIFTADISPVSHVEGLEPLPMLRSVAEWLRYRIGNAEELVNELGIRLRFNLGFRVSCFVLRINNIVSAN